MGSNLLWVILHIHIIGGGRGEWAVPHVNMNYCTDETSYLKLHWMQPLVKQSLFSPKCAELYHWHYGNSLVVSCFPYFLFQENGEGADICWKVAILPFNSSRTNTDTPHPSPYADAIGDVTRNWSGELANVNFPACLDPLWEIRNIPDGSLLREGSSGLCLSKLPHPHPSVASGNFPRAAGAKDILRPQPTGIGGRKCFVLQECWAEGSWGPSQLQHHLESLLSSGMCSLTCSLVREELWQKDAKRGSFWVLLGHRAYLLGDWATGVSSSLICKNRCSTFSLP